MGEFLSRVSKRLHICCLTGTTGDTNTVIGNFAEANNQNLVGPLNCIHPNRIQVIGTAELAYLHNLGPSAYQETLTKIFQDRPAAIIFTNAITVDPDFINHALAHSTPILVSPLSDAKLISNLHYLLINAIATRTTVHGVFMEVMGIGILLTGDPGIGKSELALALICRGHRLIADDAPEFAQVTPDILSGTCPMLLQDFLEVRGLGILNIRAMFGDSAVRRKKDLHLIVHLQRMTCEELANIDRFAGTETAFSIQGVGIPKVTIPVTPGQNLAIIVEAAARHYTLRLRGYDAAADFADRQARYIKNHTDRDSITT
ncbi:aldolase [Achromatium sp. WMS2]|nr:aldolase [Achromatium sp. WMS2]